MRGPASVLLLTTAWAAQATGQEGSATRFVCLDVEARALVVEPLATTSSIRSLRDLAVDRELTQCWSWNDICPPRRIAAGQNPLAALDGCDRSQRLEVRISHPWRPGPPEEAPRRFDLVAAPARMWREVPRHLLPTITAESPVLSLPRHADTWRLQALSGDHASPWQDVGPNQASVELTLLPASDFQFAVTADGAPLEDSRFYLVKPGRASQTETLGFEVSDGEGLVAMTLPTAERSAVIVSHDSRSAEPFPEFRDVSSTIELGPGLTVTGQALDPEGEPVGDLRLRGLSFVQDGFGVMQRHRGRTGPDGRFRIGGFFAGSASLQTEEEGNLVFSQTFNLERSVDLGPVVLRPRELAWIRVVDARDGSVVFGTRVRDPSGGWSTVNEAGLIRLSLDFGRNVAVAAKGYLRARFELPRGAGLTAEEPLTVELTPAFSVEGVFLAADGVTPAANGQVKATSTTMNGRGTEGRYSGIAADGSFSLDLPAGDWDLELTAGNAGLLRLDVRGAAGEARNLGAVSAPPSVWVWGHVVAEDDYSPVAGASVSWTRPSIIGPLVAAAVGDSATVTTDAEGYFEMFGLEVGTSTLRVQADGFASRKLVVEAPAIQGIDAGVVQLSRGRRVIVRSDVEKGVVALDSGGTGLPQDRLTQKLAEGRAAFTAVPNEPFDIRVYEGSDPVCETYEEDAEGDKVVTCNRNVARVTGLVTRDGQPADGMLVWRRRSETQIPEGIGRHDAGPFTRTEVVMSTRSLELEAPIGSDGRYDLHAVLPGEWEVLWAPLSGGRQDIQSVTVPEEREAVLNFSYDGISIEGSVIGPDGQPAPLATVIVFPSRKTVVADHNGRFQVLGLDAGTHQLRARLKHLRSTLVEAELYESTDREVVHLILENESPTEELVIAISGGGGGFCFVEMASSLPKMVRIDAGVARLFPTPPLLGQFRVACRTEGRWILDGWRDLREALDRGIELNPLDSDSSIALVGAPSPSLVQIIGPGGWELGQLRVWFDGISAFSVGETISNLPVGEYTLLWRNQNRTVWTERRRTTDVEIE